MKSLKNIYDELYAAYYPQNHWDSDYNNCDKGSLHSYIEFYENYFLNKREQITSFLEIGVQGGVSMLLWKEYFSNSKICGIDIDFSRTHENIKNNINLNLIKHDATKSSVLNLIPSSFDVIIDDGEHSFASQIASFALLKDKLNKNGTYIIEDIQSYEEAELLQAMIPTSKIIDLRHNKNRYDDLILIYENI
jgi:hypothetical protein